MRESRCKEGIPALAARPGVRLDRSRTPISTSRPAIRALGENRLALDAYAAAERADSTALVTSTSITNGAASSFGWDATRRPRPPFGACSRCPSRNDQARGHRSLAYLDMLRGRYRSAIDHLTTAVALSREPGAGLSLMRNEALLAEAYLVRGARGSPGASSTTRSRWLAPSTWSRDSWRCWAGSWCGPTGSPTPARCCTRLEAVLKPANSTDRSARGLLTAELALARGAPDARDEAIRNDIDPAGGMARRR